MKHSKLFGTKSEVRISYTELLNHKAKYRAFKLFDKYSGYEIVKVKKDGNDFMAIFGTAVKWYETGKNCRKINVELDGVMVKKPVRKLKKVAVKRTYVLKDVKSKAKPYIREDGKLLETSRNAVGFKSVKEAEAWIKLNELNVNRTRIVAIYL